MSQETDLLRRGGFAPEDLGQRRPAHVELVGGGLAGADGALDLVAGAPQQAGEPALGMALGPGEDQSAFGGRAATAALPFAEAFQLRRGKR